MVYDRRVRYLDYCKNGERVKGGGFARTEVNGDSFRLELSLKGILSAGERVAEVILTDLEGETVLGQIRLENGGGVFRYQGNLKRDFPGRELRAGQLTGLRIPISREIQVSCSWRAEEGGVRPAGKGAEEGGVRLNMLFSRGRREAEGAESPIHAKRRETESPQAEESAEDLRAEEWREERERRGNFPGSGQDECPEWGTRRNVMWEQGKEREDRKEGKDGKRGEDRKEGKGEEDGKEGPDEKKEEGREKGGRNEEERKKEKEPEKKVRTVKLMENKWRQLWAIYPHIQPFHDERDYLSLGPADFVLFSEESYRAANNSFLLHGYYNYRHLILTKLERRGEILYYLGVPGNYFDREKQVAVMFGFESFECAAEPAQEGDFGYYMMKVTL